MIPRLNAYRHEGWSGTCSDIANKCASSDAGNFCGQSVHRGVDEGLLLVIVKARKVTKIMRSLLKKTSFDTLPIAFAFWYSKFAFCAP